jgi:hypothetical protein
MDSYRDHPSDFDLPASETSPEPNDVTATIGTDERRMHVRAYNYWVSLLDGRDFPSIEDLEPADVSDFGAHSVLLDFTCGRDNPAIPYVGAAIRDECGLDDDVRTISDVPSRSLLSRLTDHYMQIIANRAPVGFEAEFENQRSKCICYRGILMPFSSDGDTIDFIYGVINWKNVDGFAQPPVSPFEMPVVEFVDPQSELAHPGLAAESETGPEPESETLLENASDEETLELTEIAEPPIPVTEPAPPAAAEEEAIDEEPLELTELAASANPVSLTPNVPAAAADGFEAQPPIHFSWEDGPLAGDDDVPVIEIDESAGLADRLWAARETAESVKAGEGRTRSALYKALSLAYDFAVAAQQNPEEYAELLEESGVKAQVRAPMTPIVKLVFGIDYDKARLTEFAAALSYAQRQEIALGAFQDFIEKQPGGLKALVAAERQARRPETKADTKGEIARARLRSAPSISLADVPAAEEFAVVVTRRGANGTHEPVAIVEDEALLERAIRRAA